MVIMLFGDFFALVLSCFTRRVAARGSSFLVDFPPDFQWICSGGNRKNERSMLAHK